jgi:hypothetical protein
MELGHFLLWIEAQSPGVIALVTLAICYAFAAIIFLLSRLVATRPLAKAMKVTTPTMLTPLSVVMGLTIAFVAARIWANFDRANGIVRDEARYIEEVLTLSKDFPPPVASEVHQAIGRYLEFAETKDWTDMLQGKGKLLTTVPGLTEAMALIVSLDTANASQRLAQQRALASLDQALDARRQRILLSEAPIMPMQWITIVVLAFLLLTFVAIVHIELPVPTALSLFALSTAIAVCMILLLVNERPLSQGGFFIGPDALRQVDLD